MKIFLIERDADYSAIQPIDPTQTLVNLDFQADELEAFNDPGFQITDSAMQDTHISRNNKI